MKKKRQFKELFSKARITEKDVTLGTFTAIASTGVVDRHGEVVSPEGWNIDNYKKDPVLLWSHDHSIMAIGKATKVWVEGYGAQAKLMFQGAWQTVTEEGRAASALVEQGILNSFSVGFLPFDMVGNTYTDQELLEISLVNVPANPEAIMLAYKSLKDSGFDETTAKKMTQKFSDISAIRKDLFSQERGALQDELDIEAMWEEKENNMDPVWEIFWAFCDVYYAQDTPVADFNDLVQEMIILLNKIVAGTYAGGDPENADPEDPVNTDNEEELSAAKDGKVIDKHKKSKRIGTKKAKVPVATAPKALSDNKLRTKQSVTKAIVKAADQLLEGEKRGITKQERVDLLKVVKRAGDILSKSNKGDLK
jgi:HK97 family phage prohead protease